MNNLINLARHIPSPDAGLTVAYTPVRLPMEGRTPLELRITAPAVGESLPIILLSHGFVCGDADDPNFTTRGPEWHADAFHDGPGADALVTLHGVGHGLGGIAGLDARETETEEPDVLEATKRPAANDIGGGWPCLVRELCGPSRRGRGAGNRLASDKRFRCALKID